MKPLIFALVALGATISSLQARFNPPDIEWQQSFGGSNRDGLFGFAETSDKGFVLGGFSASLPGGNKTSPNYGTND